MFLQWWSMVNQCSRWLKWWSGAVPCHPCSVCPLSLAAVWQDTWGSAASSVTWSGGSSSAPGGPGCRASPSPPAPPGWPCWPCCWASWLPTATGTTAFTQCFGLGTELVLNWWQFLFFCFSVTGSVNNAESSGTPFACRSRVGVSEQTREEE